MRVNNILLIIFFSLLLSEEWTMTITADDNDEVGASDQIILGMCDGCNDLFHFGEDEYDLPAPPVYYTDISFINFEWVGTSDDNGNTCDNPEFYVDKKNFHVPADLLTWNIAGFTYLNNDTSLIELSWVMDELSDDYEIFLYIDDIGYNMREQNDLLIDQNQLTVNYNPETNSFSANIQLLIGGCASEGTTTYYYDNDSDGYGGNLENSEEFCAGFEPEGWVNNNDDVDDQFYCEENIIDLCDVCNGANECLDCNNEPWGIAEIDDCGVCSGGNTGYITNSDMDCNSECDINTPISCSGDDCGTAIIDDCGICCLGTTSVLFNQDMDCAETCFGDAEIDDCEVCDGFNQSCLNEIFLDGPVNVNAYISNNTVELRWDQTNYPENEAILGFNIYRNNDYLVSTTYEEFIIEEFSDGEFCITSFDQYSNESLANCSIATDLEEFCWTLDHGLNLISYPTLPLDVSVESIFSSLNDYVIGVISEGDAASLLPNGIWVGSLTAIENHRGYWVKLDLGDPFATEPYCITGYRVPRNLEYNLSEGANLISYLGEDNELIINALTEYNDNFTAIVGAGDAAYNNPESSWVGSLTHMTRGDGYWVVVNDNFTFYWAPD